MNDDDSPLADAKHLPGRPSRPIRVLVVDADPRVRTAILETLALEADMVMVAGTANVVDAVAVAEDGDVSVALVDLLIPDQVAGLGLVRSLRLKGCSVVAMSVRSGLGDAALTAGAAGFVEKSGDIEAVLSAVRAAASPNPARPLGQHS